MTTKTTSTEERRRSEALDRARARRALEWRKAEGSIARFVALVSPEMDDVPHLRKLDRVLDLALRKPIIAFVEAPPRHGKTERLLHHCARHLKFRPTDQVAYASYSGPFAYRKSRRVRKLAARAGVWATDAPATRQRSLSRPERSAEDPASAVAYWQTMQGGAFIAGGRGGGFVGEGFGLIIVDDPFKNRAEAESDVISDSVFEDLFQGTLFQRLEPRGSMIITHQPWNDTDLIARAKQLFREQGIDFIEVTLPAVSKPKYDKLDRLIGGKALWPERFSVEQLRRIQGATSSYNFSSQYMCERVPRGKRIFLEPQVYSRPNFEHAIVGLSCDPGIVENKKRDPSSYIIGSGYLDSQGNVCIDVLLAEEHHEEIPETVDRLELLHEEHGRNGPIIMEEVSAFRAVSQIARRLDEERVKRNERPARLPIQTWVPQGSKFVRAHPTAGAIQYGRIRVPVGATWVPAFVRQLLRFTGREGGQDGMVDALVQLHDWLEIRLTTGAMRGRFGGQRESATSPF